MLHLFSMPLEGIFFHFILVSSDLTNSATWKIPLHIFKNATHRIFYRLKFFAAHYIQRKINVQKNVCYHFSFFKNLFSFSESLVSAHYHPFSAASVKATFNESLSLVRALSKHCEKFAKLMMKLSTYKNSNHIFRKFHLGKKSF